MTIREAIGFVDETFPNTFSDETKTRWLSQCDAEIWNDVMLLPTFAFEGYDWETDADLDLIVPEAYEMLYVYWLSAQMHKAYHEIAEYSNDAQMYNAARRRFTIWYADTFDPAHGGRMPNVVPPTIHRGETVTLVYEIPCDAGDVDALVTVFISEGQTVLSLAKSDVTLEGNTVTAELTQAQSLALPIGVITVQAAGETTEGKRFETQKAMKFRVRATIANEVL